MAKNNIKNPDPRATRATLHKALPTKDAEGNFLVNVVNLVGKQVTVRGPQQEQVSLFPVHGTVKVSRSLECVGYVSGAPVFKAEYELSEGLPPVSSDKFYLVTEEILQALVASGRATSDLLTPSNPFVGMVNIDCTGLIRH